MKTVLIMGAGAVRAAAGRARTFQKTPPLDRDFFDIARKSERALVDHVEQQLQSTVGAYSEEVLLSLETTATLLYLKAIDSNRNSAPHLAFLGLLTLLGRVLRYTTDDVAVGPRSLLYRVIKREIGRVAKPQDLTILTFNYDLLAERLLDELQSHSDEELFSLPECYRLPPGTSLQGIRNATGFRSVRIGHDGIALLKLHGSLNWQSKHTSLQPTPSALFNVRRELTVMDSPEVHPELRWKRNKRLVYLRPMILPPVTGKRGLLHRDFTRVWEAAAAALRDANRLVIIGYSCPPLDLEARMLIGESVAPPTLKELVVVNPNTAIASRFISLAGCSHAEVLTSVEGLLD